MERYRNTSTAFAPKTRRYHKNPHNLINLLAINYCYVSHSEQIGRETISAAYHGALKILYFTNPKLHAFTEFERKIMGNQKQHKKWPNCISAAQLEKTDGMACTLSQLKISPNKLENFMELAVLADASSPRIETIVNRMLLWESSICIRLRWIECHYMALLHFWSTSL